MSKGKVMEKGEEAVWWKKVPDMSRHGGMGEHGKLEEPLELIMHHGGYNTQESLELKLGSAQKSYQAEGRK